MKVRLLGALLAMPMVSSAHTADYIIKAASIAQEVTKGTPIFPSVQIAQAIEESGYGTSERAKELNNHFGIRTRRDKDSPYVYKRFGSMRESFRYYAKMMKGSKYYRSAMKQKTPEAQVKALAPMYCPLEGYADRIIKIIHRYGLEKYDQRVCVKQYSFTLKQYLHYGKQQTI